jgi:hypothetical protein
MKIESIKTAEDLLCFAALHGFTVPLDAGAVAKLLGIKVIRHKTEQRTRGRLTQNKRGKWVLEVSAWKYYLPEFISYAIAYELGHWVLHRNLKTEFVEELESLNVIGNPLCKEADAFACYVLDLGKFWGAE